MEAIHCVADAEMQEMLHTIHRKIKLHKQSQVAGHYNEAATRVTWNQFDKYIESFAIV